MASGNDNSYYSGPSDLGHSYETAGPPPGPGPAHPPPASSPYPPPNATAPPSNAPYPPQPNVAPYPQKNNAPYPTQTNTPYPAQPNTAPYPPQNQAPYPPQNSPAYPPPQSQVSQISGSVPNPSYPPPPYSPQFGSNTNFAYQGGTNQQTQQYPQQPAPTVVIQNNQIQQPAAPPPSTITIVRTTQVDAGPQPHDFLCLSIVSFFFCFIFGIVAIINSSQVKSHWRQGRHEEARRAAARAKGFAIAALVIGVVIIIVNILGDAVLV